MPGDPELRREVESLLLASDEADGFLTPDHLGKHINDMAGSARSLPGETLGRYRIVSRVGAGAMGEVYLARDLELGRRAAIKVLADPLQTGGEMARRFVQESTSGVRVEPSERRHRV